MKGESGMHIEILVEEPSAEAALKNLLPKMLPAGLTFKLHNFQSKLTLLAELPRRLQGYKNWMPVDWRFVVLVDEDREDCFELKARLEQAAIDAGLVTKSVASEQKGFQVLNRIVIEELGFSVMSRLSSQHIQGFL
jgi:hypothetical protein